MKKREIEDRELVKRDRKGEREGKRTREKVTNHEVTLVVENFFIHFVHNMVLFLFVRYLSRY